SRVLAMAGTQARTRGFAPQRHVEPHRSRHVSRRHGGCRDATVCAHVLAAAALARGGRARRLAAWLGCASGVRLHHRRFRRRSRLRLVAWLDLVCCRARGLRARHPAAAGFRLVARVSLAMRLCYAIALALGLTAILADHLTSPSVGRAMSPEDFAGA